MPALLDPISDVAPCGDDLSYSPEFDRIQDLKREDDPTLDQGVWVAALKTADWPAVLARCDSLLATRTKDLRLLAWRVEALARLDGRAGLARGLGDCRRVAQAWWDALHPAAEARAGTLAWLLALLVRLLRAQPAVAADLEPLAEAREHLQALQELADARLGDESPSFVAARAALDDAHDDAQRLAQAAGGAAGARTLGAGAARSLGATGGAAQAPGGVGSSIGDCGANYLNAGPLATRAEALQRLREVADFFRRTEPHSPVALLADKAARWGELPLQDWLREVVKDAGSLAHVEELLGLPRAE